MGTSGLRCRWRWRCGTRGEARWLCRCGPCFTFARRRFRPFPTNAAGNSAASPSWQPASCGGSRRRRTRRERRSGWSSMAGMPRSLSGSQPSPQRPSSSADTGKAAALCDLPRPVRRDQRRRRGRPPIYGKNRISLGKRARRRQGQDVLPGLGLSRKGSPRRLRQPRQPGHRLKREFETLDAARQYPVRPLRENRPHLIHFFLGERSHHNPEP